MEKMWIKVSIQIISVDFPLDDKDEFETNVIEYSDFKTYMEHLKFDNTLIFTPHVDRVEVYYKKSNGGIYSHQAWVVTE
jgi:hypothetical protein